MRKTIKRVLVIGGYGTFGKRLSRSLIAYHDIEVIIAGRSLIKARTLQLEFEKEFQTRVNIQQIDVYSSNLVCALQQNSPDIVVNAAGPFQKQFDEQGFEAQYRVAKACVKLGCHYVDLADDRQFVSNFSAALDCRALRAGVSLVTGASTVPALTCAVIDDYLSGFKKITEIDYGISPGNRTERGQATVSSILSYTGKAFYTRLEGGTQPVFGWQDLNHVDFGFPIGKRWMSNCEIPDLDLLSRRYKSLKRIRFQAGLEVSMLHLGLWLLSWFVKLGFVNNLSYYSKPLIAISEWFSSFGSDCGGMFIKLSGIDSQNQDKMIKWQLVAEAGDGPNVPTIAAEIIIAKLSDGKIKTGAQSCMGLFSLDEFFAIAKRWNISQSVTEQEV